MLGSDALWLKAAEPKPLVKVYTTRAEALAKARSATPAKGCRFQARALPQGGFYVSKHRTRHVGTGGTILGYWLFCDDHRWRNEEHCEFPDPSKGESQ